MCFMSVSILAPSVELGSVSMPAVQPVLLCCEVGVWGVVMFVPSVIRVVRGVPSSWVECVFRRADVVFLCLLYTQQPPRVRCFVLTVVCRCLCLILVVEVHSSMGPAMALYVEIIVSFCFPHVVDVSALSICIVCACFCYCDFYMFVVCEFGVESVCVFLG